MVSLGRESAINPSLNAVIDAFDRRRFWSRFTTPGHDINMDTMLDSRAKMSDDCDKAIGGRSLEYSSDSSFPSKVPKEQSLQYKSNVNETICF